MSDHTTVSIPIIPPPSPRDFFEQHVIPHRPVVIDGLYRGQPIDEVRTVDRAIEVLGDARFVAGINGYDSNLRVGQTSDDDFACSVAGYFRLIEREPDTQAMNRETESPDELRALFTEPGIASTPHCVEEHRSLFYLAKRGLVAPLHFDGDQRDVLLTQVVGRKRVALMPPGLAPRFYPTRNFSGLAIHHLPEAEKDAWLAWNGAFVCTLDPGQTVYIPKLWWHYVENPDHSLAFNVRFGRYWSNRWLRVLPSNYLVQNIAHALVDRRTGALVDEGSFRSLFEAYYAPAVEPQVRYERVQDTSRDIYRRVCAEAIQGEYITGRYSRVEHDELETIAAGVDQREGNGYYNPAMTVPPSESAAPVGHDALARMAAVIKKRAISEDRLAYLLRSLGVSSSLAELTRLEACVVFEFLQRRWNY